MFKDLQFFKTEIIINYKKFYKFFKLVRNFKKFAIF